MLSLTTCLAQNTDPVCRDIAVFLSSKMDMPLHFVNDKSWAQREQLLADGRINIGWICGLLYVRLLAETGADLRPLAAPILAADSYRDRPIYFSQIIVHEASTRPSFLDLRGTSFAVNEPGSFSGCVVVQTHLAAIGQTDGFFSEVVETGSHWQSLQAVAGGRVTAAAIDSTALDFFCRQHPHLCQKIRIIEVLGPYPIPLFVVQNRVPSSHRKQIRTQLLHLSDHAAGQRLLQKHGLKRFTAVQDADYNPLRQAQQLADQVRLVPPSRS